MLCDAIACAGHAFDGGATGGGRALAQDGAVPAQELRRGAAAATEQQLRGGAAVLRDVRGGQVSHSALDAGKPFLCVHFIDERTCDRSWTITRNILS